MQQQIETIDFVVCDLNMPMLDGIEFLNQIKYYSNPVVIISGTFDVVIKMAQETGDRNNLNVIGTLHEPFIPAQLDSLIAEIRAGS